jgi:hypothetical protein
MLASWWLPRQVWPSLPTIKTTTPARKTARKTQTPTRKIQMACRSRRMTRPLPILILIPKAARPASRRFLVALTGLQRVIPIVSPRARSARHQPRFSLSKVAYLIVSAVAALTCGLRESRLGWRTHRVESRLLLIIQRGVEVHQSRAKRAHGMRHGFEPFFHGLKPSQW